MIYALGMFAFAADTLLPDSLVRRADWQIATTPRFGARDAAQFAGPGTETISLSGAVYAEIADGPVSLDRLRTMADSGDSWSLVDGAGRVYGAYLLRGLDERHVQIGRDGTPARIDFGIDLLRVDEAPAR